MALQDTFYVLGIICMSMMLVILITIVVVLFYIKKKIGEIHGSVTDTLDSVQHTMGKVSDVAGSFGSNFAGTAVETVKALIQRKREHDKNK